MPKVQNATTAASTFAAALGALLIQARQHRGLTRERVIETMSPAISLSTLRRIEVGSKAPDVNELRAIVAAINALNPEDGYPKVSVPALISKAEKQVGVTTSVADSTTP